MKYTPEMVDKIVELYETGEYTQQQLCKIVGIKAQTFIGWRNDKPEFAERLKEADEERIESTKAMAFGGLRKLLQGGELKDVSIETGIKGTVTKETTKQFAPNPTAVIFTLKNLYPEKFADKSEVINHNLNTELNIDFSKLTDEELNTYEQLILKAGSNKEGKEA